MYPVLTRWHHVALLSDVVQVPVGGALPPLGGAILLCLGSVDLGQILVVVTGVYL